MRNLFLAGVLWLFSATTTLAKVHITGMYGQWGYNFDKYSKSDIRFVGDDYDFVIHNAEAKHKPDFSGLRTNPLQLTIPQYSYRIGFYLDEKKHRSIEVNFDHTKYVVTDNQLLRITGRLHEQTLDKDTIISPDFIHFEHTNGANFLQINYAARTELVQHKKGHEVLGLIYKAGAGIVIPKSDVTLMGERRDNPFHVAGYVLGAEAGFRFYPARMVFFELTGKAGFANYTDVLTIGNGRAKHHFFYGEAIALVGIELNFKKKQQPAAGQ